MKTYAYALPTSAGLHGVSVHDEATIRAVLYDGTTLRLIADADPARPTSTIVVAVVWATAGGVTAPSGMSYVGSVAVGDAMIVVYR